MTSLHSVQEKLFFLHTHVYTLTLSSKLYMPTWWCRVWLQLPWIEIVQLLRR